MRTVAAGRVHRPHCVSEAKIDQIQTYDCHSTTDSKRWKPVVILQTLWLLTSQSLIHFILLNGKFNFWTLVGHPAGMKQNINQQMIFDNNKRHQQSIVKFRGSIFSNARTFFLFFFFQIESRTRPKGGAGLAGL